MDCTVSLESCTEPDRVMYCAHPASGTGNNSQMYCYNMKPVSTSLIFIFTYFSFISQRLQDTVSVCGGAVEMVQSDVVCVCCVDFHDSSLVSRFICSQWFNLLLFDKCDILHFLRNASACATSVKVISIII